MTNLHELRRISFNEVARLYDKARPGYPPLAAEALLDIARMPTDGRILEIGCGTGKATTLFAKFGYEMVCLEPGENLTAVLKENIRQFPNVTIRQEKFEDWEPDGKFDLIVSAQAFDWLQPDVACNKTPALLKPGGVMGLIWNMQPATDAAIDAIYTQIVPEITVADPGASLQTRIDRRAAELVVCERFALQEVRTYPHEITYDAISYTDLLQTYSDHRTLPVEKLEQLQSAIAAEINKRPGGVMIKKYVTAVFIVRPIVSSKTVVE